MQCPTPAQVMISWLMDSSPASGYVLTVQSIEPASDSVSTSLRFPCMCAVSLSLSKINIKKNVLNKIKYIKIKINSISILATKNENENTIY